MNGHVTNQQLAIGLLGKWGHQVTVVDNGLSAVKQCLDGEFDLVIIDQLMPGLLGVEVIERWHEEGIDTDFLVLTGVDDDRVVSDYVKLGAEDVVNKPFHLPRLLRDIDERLKS